MQDNDLNVSQDVLKEYTSQIKRTLRYIFIWGAFVSLNAYFFGNKIVVVSFLLGLIASILYYIFMCQRVKKSADMPPLQAISYMRYGWAVRLCFVLAVLIIALKIPGIEFGAVVVGLFSLQIVTFLEALTIVTIGLISRYKKS